MARILMVYFSDYGEAMYDAITDVLRCNGNDLFRLNINNPKVSITHWGGESKISNTLLLNQIREFGPDVVLSFNNCLPQNCYDGLPEKCCICAIDADAPAVAFWNKDMIEKYFDKIRFLGLQSYSKKMYEDYTQCSLTDDNYLYFPPATVVKTEKLKQDKNISFIGSNFYPLAVPSDDLFYSNDALKLFDAFKENYFLTFEQAKEIMPSCDHMLYEMVRAYYCGQDRLKYMQQLTDLGFTFYGVRWWNHIAYVDFELAKCFDPTPKISIEENQWVYNTSKISINISHPLAKSSFSWRVMDIMASNSCLLTEDKPDWRDLFEKYLSPETLDAIIYKDRFDMRDKAKRLLADDALRKKCVAELNNAIEQNGRWDIRFASLERFLGIKLLECKNEQPQYIRIQRDQVEQKSSENNAVQEQNLVAARIKTTSGIKKRLKNSFYLTMLLIGQIPVLDHFVCDSHKRKKMLSKLNKWWR